MIKPNWDRISINFKPDICGFIEFSTIYSELLLQALLYSIKILSISRLLIENIFPGPFASSRYSATLPNKPTATSDKEPEMSLAFYSAEKSVISKPDSNTRAVSRVASSGETPAPDWPPVGGRDDVRVGE